jgi:tetratricopeptide (TPR) repeat protein
LLNLVWDFTAPEKEFKRAIELNPNGASVRTLYAFYLERIGRISEALAEMNLVLLLDPVSSRSAVTAGFAYYFARQFDQAMAHIKKTYALEPNTLQFFFPFGGYLRRAGSMRNPLPNSRRSATNLTLWATWAMLMLAWGESLKHAK